MNLSKYDYRIYDCSDKNLGNYFLLWNIITLCNILCLYPPTECHDFSMKSNIYYNKYNINV